MDEFQHFMKILAFFFAGLAILFLAIDAYLNRNNKDE